MSVYDFNHSSVLRIERDKMKIDWLIIKRNLEGTASEQEVEEYRGWVSENDTHGDYMDKVKRNYHKQNEFKIISDQFVENKLLQFERSIVQTSRRKVLKRTISVAASLLLLFGAGGAFYYNSLSQNKSPLPEMAENVVREEKMIDHSSVLLTTGESSIFELEKDHVVELLSEELNLNSNELDYRSIAKGTNDIQIHTLTVPNGKTWNITLSDGTKVFLNAASELKFPNQFVTGESRTVSLKGEGYFEVAHNPESQFIVKAGEIDVKVYGTKFNINSHKEGKIETVLLEGSVSVILKNSNEEIRVKPNEMALFRKESGKISVGEVNAMDHVLWKDGILLFNEVSLESILEELAKWYDYKVEFENEKVRNEIIYCKVPRPDTIEPVLDAISRNGTMRYEIVNKTIYIK